MTENTFPEMKIGERVRFADVDLRWQVCEVESIHEDASGRTVTLRQVEGLDR